MMDDSGFTADTLEKKISLIESILFVSGEPVEPEKLINDPEKAAIFAKIMGMANKELAGKADGKTIATIVKQQLM